MTKKNLLLATSAAALLSVGVGTIAPAMAQQLEEIIVSARKIEENLMTVPLAITAFSSKDIDAMGLKQMSDVSMFTPSFHFVQQQGASGRNDRSSNALSFRGLYLGSNTGITAGGLLFIDGSPVIGAQPPSNTDLQRIEVLKGPQSAYFGRSTFVGAINYVTRDPGDVFKGRASAEYSSYGSNEETLSFEGPLIADKVNARISGRHWARGGQYTNAADTSQKLGAQSTNSVSGTFVIRPNDDLKVKAFVNYFEDRDGAPAQGALKQDSFNCKFNFTPPAGLTAAQYSRPTAGYYCGAVPNADKVPASFTSGDYTITPYLQNGLFNNVNQLWTIFDPHFNTEAGLRRKALQADMKADYETQGGYTISSLTAYHRDKSQTILDLNYRDSHDRPNPFAAAIPGVIAYQNFTLVAQALSRDWSQELRITSPQKDQRFRWTFGANYLDAASPGGPVYGSSPAGFIFTSSITRSQIQTPAVFGAGYFDIVPDLTLSAEARYQWDKVKQTPFIGGSGTVVTGLAATPLQSTFKSFSPRISLDYKYAPDSTAYLLWSRGYRPGGFNTALVVNTPAVVAQLLAVVPNGQVAYQQEKLDNYEAGIKSTWLDGRARTQLSIYYDRWTNGQVTNSIPLASITNLQPVTVNTGLAILKGVEFEGQIQATEKLKLQGTFALNDTDVRSYVCSECFNVYGSYSDVVGHKLPTTPKWTWTLSGEYADHLTGTLDWFGRVDYAHQGKNYTDFSNVAWVPASNTVNLRIGVRNENVTVEAFVTNLTDSKVMAAALQGIDVFTFLFPPNKNEIRYSLPIKRMFGARASYNF